LHIRQLRRHGNNILKAESVSSQLLQVLQTLELMGFEKEDIFLLETSSIKSLLKGIVNIRSHFNGRRVSAIVLEPFTRFSTLLSAWIGASK
jgi:hypothetical protein